MKLFIALSAVFFLFWATLSFSIHRKGNHLWKSVLSGLAIMSISVVLAMAILGIVLWGVSP